MTFLSFFRRRDADIIHIDEYRKMREALAPVIQLAPRKREQSSIEFLFGIPPRAVSSWGRAEVPTRTAGTGLAAVRGIEQAEHAAPAGVAHAGSMPLAPRTTGRGARGLLHNAETAPLHNE